MKAAITKATAERARRARAGSREQHLWKTRYQNLATETDPKDRAFVLSSETPRHRNP